MTEVLVLYYSRTGSTAELARQVCRGVESVPGATSRLRPVPAVAAENEEPMKLVPSSGAPYATVEDLRTPDALWIGTPTRSGTMAAAPKYFMSGTSRLWVSGALSGQPAGVFASPQSVYAGQGVSLLSTMLPSLHPGMVIVGLPYTERAFNE